MKDEVYAIIGGAMEVSNEFGAQFLEAVYLEALAAELRSRGIAFDEQSPIRYKGIELQKKYKPH